MLRIRHNDALAAAPARLWAEIDLGAVRANVARLRGRLRRGCAFVAVVKADGYGHGAVAIAQAALTAGAAELAVADVREGAVLRAAGIAAPILVVGPSAPAEAVALVAHRLVPAVADLELAGALAQAATAAGARAPVAIEIEVDTGMRRHGVPVADLLQFVRALRLHRTLRIAGVFTHFAGTEASAMVELRAQWQAFAAAVAALRATGVDVRAHACNTLGAMLLPEAHADAVRIGGGMYGFDPGRADFVLQPALTLASRIVGLRAAARGDRIGYGGAHVCGADTRLGLLPCGYADGLSRAHWNGADVLVRGRRARVVGHVSMNQMVVDLGDIAAALGDEVVLLGSQAGIRLRAEERAAHSCSPYEVTALLRPELVRSYRDGAQSAPLPG